MICWGKVGRALRARCSDGSENRPYPLPERMRCHRTPTRCIPCQRVNWPTCQLVCLVLVNRASGPPGLYSKGYSSPSAKKLWASRRREQPSAVTKVMSEPVVVMRRHHDGSFDP